MSRPGAEERLGRLLAIVPWIAARDGPPIAVVCQRFGVTEHELLADLDLLFLCGVYPFTPDVLIEVDITDDRVWIRFADYFRRPLRLTPPEGLALISAGSALLRVPGADQDGALARALEKLASVLGVGSDDTVDVELAPVSPRILAAVQTAAAERRRVELDYYSFGRDELTRRVVDPYAVFSAGGQWYVSAHCHAVDDDRLFRIDRVRAASLLDTPVQHAGGIVAAAVYRPRADDPRVTIELEPAGRWVAEQYPVEQLKELSRGRLRVTLAVSERAWLERLLLRLGTDGRVTKSSDAVLADAGRAAACRVAERYRSSGR